MISEEYIQMLRNIGLLLGLQLHNIFLYLEMKKTSGMARLSIVKIDFILKNRHI